jgi:hypothetical protein
MPRSDKVLMAYKVVARVERGRHLDECDHLERQHIAIAAEANGGDVLNVRIPWTWTTVTSICLSTVRVGPLRALERVQLNVENIPEILDFGDIFRNPKFPAKNFVG